MWYQDTINLFEHKIIGPFDVVDDEQNIPQQIFEVLLEKTSVMKVYMGDVNRTIPLDKLERLYQADDGTFNNYRSYR
jgi:hypothetical protein